MMQHEYKGIFEFRTRIFTEASPANSCALPANARRFADRSSAHQRRSAILSAGLRQPADQIPAKFRQVSRTTVTHRVPWAHYNQPGDNRRIGQAADRVL
jgi:hypothetical protein